MTSAEFAAKYRVLKTLTEHGARTEIAQEVALGRMVMVHHLDVGTSAERQRLVAKVGGLTPDAAAKVFDVVTVDGTRVIVTHFLATFSDLPSWLEENSASPDPSEAKTVVMEPPQLPTPAPAPGGFTSVFGAPATPAAAATPEVIETPVASDPIAPPTAPTTVPPTQKGSFTEIFAGAKPPAAPRGKRSTPRASGRVATPAAPPPAAVPPAAAPPAAEAAGDFTRVFQGKAPTATDPARPVTPPPTADAAPPMPKEPTAPAAPPVSAPPPASFAPPPVAPKQSLLVPNAPALVPPVTRRPSDASFTSVFGATPSRSSDAVPPEFRPTPPAPSIGPPGPPLSPRAARFDSVMPPVEAPPPPRPVAPPPPAPAPSMNSTSEDFNALFARLNPTASAQPSAPPAYAAPSAPPPPNLGGQPPAAMLSAAPAPPTPPAAPGIPSLARMAGGPASPPPARGPSEFTRVLGRLQPPPVSPPAARLPDAGSSTPGFPTPAVPQPQAPPPAKAAKSRLPVIIALNLLAIGAIIVVAYFVTRH